jgi:large subunit ribosomal protein L24e
MVEETGAPGGHRGDGVTGKHGEAVQVKCKILEGMNKGRIITRNTRVRSGWATSSSSETAREAKKPGQVNSMVDTKKCLFCGKQMEPGTGKMLVKKDGSIQYFCSSKCENNMKMGRIPRLTEWAKKPAKKE